MKHLKILEKNCDVGNGLFLEASAGTGKTFSIEHLFVRLIVESKEFLSVDRILVVTFTKAAAYELKQRIFETLKSALKQLKSDDEPVWGYLQKNKESMIRLQLALAGFDDVSIYTIHGFCQKVLSDLSEENAFIDALERENGLEIVRDFLRVEVNKQTYSASQIESVVRYFGNDYSALAEALYHASYSTIPIENYHNFSDRCKLLKPLQNAISAGKFREIAGAIAPYYKGIFQRDGQMREDINCGINLFSSVLEKEEWNREDYEMLFEQGDLLAKKFCVENLTQKALKSTFQQDYLPDVFDQWMQAVKGSESVSTVFSRMAQSCQKLLRDYIKQEEFFRYDDLIDQVDALIQKKSSFREKLIASFSAVIVDEFQDTDLQQWSILQRVFERDVPLYLVGDPKQAIYAFRQADIYTYLEASRVFSSDQRAFLDTNYRSTPSLVRGLNRLFDPQQVPNLFILPAAKEAIPYHLVTAAREECDWVTNDRWGSVHFIGCETELGRGRRWPSEECEEKFLFPYLVNEIDRLRCENNIPFSHWAVLVRDRHQADRLGRFCHQAGIPVLLQREQRVVDSPAYESLLMILEAALSPYDLSATKRALSSSLIGWSGEAVANLSDDEELAKIAEQIHFLHSCLVEGSFSSFYAHLLEAPLAVCHGKNFSKNLLEKKGGLKLYRALQHMARVTMLYEGESRRTPQQIYLFLKHFHKHYGDEDSASKIPQDQRVDAVNILTIHMSKGLEYPIVFALGIATRSVSGKKGLLFVRGRGKERVRIAASETSDEELKEQAAEEDAEKRRLLYVALTRAKERLYIPMPLTSDQKRGSTSALEEWLLEWKTELSRAGVEKLFKRLVDEKAVTAQWIEPSVVHLMERVLQPAANPIAPKKRNYDFPIIKVSSFTSLTKSMSATLPEMEAAEGISFHTLPKGSATGILLHTILEKTPFSLVQNSEGLEDHVAPFIVGTPLQEWGSVIAQMVRNAFSLPITTEEGEIYLSECDERAAYREMEFTFQTNPFQWSKVYGGEERDSIAEKYLKGVIDLIFLHRERYYILDWKSNWLGPSGDYYTQDSLQRSMEEHHYFLQAAIYQEALKAYLKQVEKRPFEECFGGTIYLFLRGREDKNIGRGVYYLPSKTTFINRI